MFHTYTKEITYLGSSKLKNISGFATQLASTKQEAVKTIHDKDLAIKITLT